MKKISGIVWIFGALLLGWTGSACCGTVTVSGTTTVFTTIQAGVNACPVDGTVSVAAGIYIEAICINKRIVLIGAGSASTTITAAGLGATNTVTFDGNEADNARIAEFGITGATGSNLNGNGILCNNGADPTITNNIITENSCRGILCFSSSSPAITNNTLSRNDSIGILCYFSSSPVITSNIIEDSENGIYCYSSSSPTIATNTISENSKNGIYCSSSSPAIITNTISRNGDKGIYCLSSSPMITNNIISENTYDGIYCDSSSTSTITSNTISENNRDGISCNCSSPVIINNIILRNNSGINCFLSSPTIINNTISRNREDGIYCSAEFPAIINNIITENAATSTISYGICAATPDTRPILDYNCVWGNGPGNPGTRNYYDCDSGAHSISVNPQFISNIDFHLQPASPCINKGTNTSIGTLSVTDKDGNPRIVDGTVDMGAYEYQWTPSIFPSITITPISGTVGTPITVSGNSFKPNEYIWISVGTAVLAKKTMSNVSGSFSTSFLAQVQIAGETTVTAYGLSSSCSATSSFTLQPFASNPQAINDLEAFNPTCSSVSLRWGKWLEQADTRREIDARRALNALKAAITLYYKDNGKWPEFLDNQAHGSSSAFIPKYFSEIPYATLKRWQQHSRSKNVLTVSTTIGEDIPLSAVTDAGGWIYSSNSGDIRINCSCDDMEAVWHASEPGKYSHPGRKYYQYGHDGDDGFNYYRYYDVRCSTSPITEANWDSLPKAPGVRITPYKQPFSPYSEEGWDGFLAWDLGTGTTYYLACRVQDQTGQWSGMSNVASMTTSAIEAKITDLTVSTVTSTSASLKWTAPTLINYIDQTRDMRTIYNLDMLQAAINRYYQENQHWPHTLDANPYGQLPAFVPTYVQAIPPASLRLNIPHSNSGSVQVVHTSEESDIAPPQITDHGGWIYSPDSGDLRINCTHTDTVMFGYDEFYHPGSITYPYYQYRHEEDKCYRWEGLKGDINCGSGIIGYKGGTPTVAIPEYVIKYATFTITEENWSQANTYTTASEPKLGGMPEQINISGLEPGINYYFAVKTMDWARDTAGLSNVVSLNGLTGEESLLITLATQTTLGTLSSPPVPGAEIIYAITYENIGQQEIQNLSITDKPDLTNADYVAGSLRMGTSGSTYETAVGKTDNRDIDEADWTGGIVTFDVGNVPSAGKGRVYFRVRIR